VSGHLLHHLLSEAGQREPDRVAVRSGDASLTYGELDLAADRVAGALVDLGVGRGDRVGLHLGKTPEAIAAVYGILRTGGAYVPLDPVSPATRSALIARDCEISALVTDDAAGVAALRARDPGVAARGIVRTGAAPPGFVSWDSVQAGAQGPPCRDVVDTDLGYILYTSGSTGRPKGVMISHRNSLTFVRWAAAEFRLTPDDILSNHAPLHFDLSIFDLFAAARAAATVAPVPAVTALFPGELAQWIAGTGITVWYSAPSALMLLVRSGSLPDRAPESLRLVIFAGEVFPNRQLAALMRAVPDARYFNLYGPTETNVCTFHEVLEPPAPTDPPIPIGRACANTRCEVVDDEGRVITEPGVEGQLRVHGSVVAQGYWGDPEKTAARFREPYTYETGDVVSWAETPDEPVLRFLGRRDHMVKVRGYRVELGEIESVLNSHPSVEEAAVVAVPDEILGNRIVAYCAAPTGPGVGELTRLCRERLPLYMVPQRVVPVDVLPRTSTGKVDRTVLQDRAADDVTRSRARL
jgi:amino acid adenylation domain-containing protein